MTTYISILRGINVSGQRLIKMEALRAMYQSMGFGNVRSYVQSGNIVFDAPQSDTKVLEQKISVRIGEEFGFDVPVIIMNSEKIKKVIENNPFLKDAGKNPDFLHVTFLSSTPSGHNYDFSAIESKKREGEEIILSDDVVYLYCPHGYGNTKLTNNLLESRLKTGATTRNWKTTKELLKMTGV